MKKNSKVLFIVSTLILLFIFSGPIWRITLEAPQYPDGVTMYIYINKIGGDEPGTLQNFNIINHYVGMKKIDEESIPELKYFPIIIIAVSAIGVILGFLNNRKLWIAWIILIIILGILGIYDFYLWEYDYGHDISPEAPIKIPGMVYQPPLIGSKKMLNFNAISYPHWGSAFVGLSLIGASLAVYFKR